MHRVDHARDRLGGGGEGGGGWVRARGGGGECCGRLGGALGSWPPGGGRLHSGLQHAAPEGGCYGRELGRERRSGVEDCPQALRELQRRAGVARSKRRLNLPLRLGHECYGRLRARALGDGVPNGNVDHPRLLRRGALRVLDEQHDRYLVPVTLEALGQVHLRRGGGGEGAQEPPGAPRVHARHAHRPEIFEGADVTDPVGGVRLRGVRVKG
mmetsp:Transcript_57485/g.182067  ORF Transcript_57485/g.182067 Transcript_57485/m.182067 type:complete len:212 (+) Transcript_57485:2866-3501(+)